MILIFQISLLTTEMIFFFWNLCRVNIYEFITLIACSCFFLMFIIYCWKFQLFFLKNILIFIFDYLFFNLEYIFVHLLRSYSFLIVITFIQQLLGNLFNILFFKSLTIHELLQLNFVFPQQTDEFAGLLSKFLVPQILYFVIKSVYLIFLFLINNLFLFNDLFL